MRPSHPCQQIYKLPPHKPPRDLEEVRIPGSRRPLLSSGHTLRRIPRARLDSPLKTSSPPRCGRNRIASPAQIPWAGTWSCNSGESLRYLTASLAIRKALVCEVTPPRQLLPPATASPSALQASATPLVSSTR